MPSLSSSTDLLSLIDLTQVYIHPSCKRGWAFVGLLFSSTWDEEHGLGVVMCADKVVEIGGADTAFLER